MARYIKVAAATIGGMVLLLALPVFSVTQGNSGNVMPNNPPQANVPVGTSPYGGVAPESMNLSGNAAVNNRRADWEKERQYWREHYSSAPYYHSNADYSMYEPAYQYGFNIYAQNGGQPWEHLNQRLLHDGWERAHGNSNLSWDQAQDAARDAYTRAQNQNAVGQNTVNPAMVQR